MTTILIDKDTHMVLNALKSQYKAKSYNEVIMKLVAKATRPRKSMFGSGGKMPMKNILEGLRDRHDRY